jgi:hypothetical protein
VAVPVSCAAAGSAIIAATTNVAARKGPVIDLLSLKFMRVPRACCSTIGPPQEIIDQPRIAWLHPELPVPTIIRVWISIDRNAPRKPRGHVPTKTASPHGRMLVTPSLPLR